MIKRYVYISDRKLESLRNQIGIPTLERTAKTVKGIDIDLKFLRINFEREATPATREAMVKVVSKYLLANEEVGTVDQPKAYFQGSLPMKWGPSEDVRPPVVVFTGATESSVVVLGGSLKGAIDKEEIRSKTDAPLVVAEWNVVEVIADSLEAGQSLEATGKQRKGDWAESVFQLNAYLRGREEELEFLAVREGPPSEPLAWGGHRRTALVGSPIYVARV